MDTATHLRLLLDDRRSKCNASPTAVNPLTLKPISPNELLDVYPAGASELDIARFAISARIAMPKSLSAWLSISNGAAGFFGVPPVDDRCSFEHIWSQFPAFREKHWIPVARDDFGNFYVQFLTQPVRDTVYFVETIGDHVPYAVASDMLRFAEFYLESEAAADHYPWPFDKKFVLSRDPQLAKVDVVCAWDT
jgi:hypothetical protein